MSPTLQAVTEHDRRQSRWGQEVATSRDSRRHGTSRYKRSLARLLASTIPRHQRVLQIGCGIGDVLRALALPTLRA